MLCKSEIEIFRTSSAAEMQVTERGEATALFARPRLDGLEGIFGNLNQTLYRSFDQ